MIFKMWRWNIKFRHVRLLFETVHIHLLPQEQWAKRNFYYTILCTCVFPENLVLKAATEHDFLYNLSLIGHFKFLLKDVFFLLFVIMKVLTGDFTGYQQRYQQ